ncbi:unnamed protein product [Effrenium voratum]|uniref:Uncharacterized protein n=1 Tax=Effrenium voratum TaxID=2562239 RepID=A0AA36IJ60_9DINO|nr:unnamed protein product [Effrenium voratum]
MAPIKAAADGYFYVLGTDGTRLRCRLLLGGPRGDNSLDPRARTAICLHGVGANLGFWEEGVFRTKPFQPEAFGDLDLSDAGPADEVRRAKFARALARRINVVIMDQRGFGASDRPRTLAPMVDETITLLSRWRVPDLGAFTAAARAELRLAQACGAAAHCVSLRQGVASVRLSFWSLRFLGAFMGSLPSLEQRLETCPGATLELMEVLGPRQRLQELSYLQQPALEKAPKLTRSSASFHNDVLSSDALHVAVVHRFRKFNSDACEQFVQEVKDNDSYCISLSMSASEETLVLIGVFQQMEAAEAYAQRSKSLGEAEIQVHARTAELKKLKDQSLDRFQVFPLSYEDKHTTDRSVNMNDLVSDVEEVRRFFCGTGQVSICGHSMGAAVGLQYAVQYPQHVERLCLCAAAPRVGQAAYDNWMRIAGDARTWESHVIRGVVAVVNIPDELIRQVAVGTLLINAKDDKLTPVIGSEMVNANLQRSILYVPETGGHNCQITSDEAMERTAQFLMADPAMLFVVDKLLQEQLVNTWNLPGDQNFLRYYHCGRALAEVERLERGFRVWSPAVGKVEAEQAKRRVEEELKRIASRLGLAETEVRKAILAEMVRMTSRMSTPAREVVEKAAVWWRDSGAAEKLPEKKGYSVDAWGRRRGGSTQGACHVFRYDLSALPVRVKASLAEKQKTDMSGFACQWCGGPPSAHQDVGAANEEELRQQRAVALMAKAQLAAEEMKANTAQELKALADAESRDTLEAGQGSYVQKDCPWMPGLKALGASRQEQDALLQSLRLELQSEELRRWAGSCDLVALQEVDTSLRQALGDATWVESAWHVDGRGVRVDSRVALLLPAGSKLHVERTAHCQLRVPLRSGRGHAERDHAAAVMSSDGQSLAVCSVHLHPPTTSSAVAYVEYLAPLKEMLLDLAPLPKPIALLGDFNVSPASFAKLTAEDGFWRAFTPVCPTTATAFETNPCPTGDYMLFRADGTGVPAGWRCEALGAESFQGFRSFCRLVLADSAGRLPWLRAAQAAERALQSSRQAERQLQDLIPRTPPTRSGTSGPVPPVLPVRAGLRVPPPPPAREEKVRPMLEQLRAVSTQLEVQAQELSRATESQGVALPKGLESSDHRPLIFETIVE